MRDPEKKKAAFLSVIAHADRSLLAPLLETVELKPRQDLTRNRDLLHKAFFLSEGMASVQARSPTGRLAAEIAMIGREGLIGSASALGLSVAPYSIIVQVGGLAHSISIAELVRAMDMSATLQRSVMNFYHTITVQAGQSALCNAVGKADERLARWLLMAQDRVAGDPLAFSHESIARLICLRRPAITTTLRRFHCEGSIRIAARKNIVITDRSALERVASRFYGVSEKEYDRVFSRIEP